MIIKKALKAIFILFFTASLFFVVYGMLFPWLPLKPGYSAIKTERATVYSRDTSALDPAYSNIDAYITEAETFHGLKFKKNVSVIALSHKWECLIHTGRTKGKAVTLPTGDAIYVRPQKRPFPAEDFIKHELSHCLLFQNMNPVSSWKTSERRWVVEGSGIAFGGPRYMSDADFKRKLREPGGASEHAGAGEFTNKLNDFTYTLYGEFIKSLIKTYGPEKLREFFHEYSNQPSELDRLFIKIFGISPNNALKSFVAEQKK